MSRRNPTNTTSTLRTNSHNHSTGDNLDKKEFEKNVNKLLLCIIITIGVVTDFLYNKSLLNLCLAIIVLTCTLIIFFGKLIWKKYY